ncbi:MAG: GlxA family transcriptional regulator [Methylocystis sp.]|uniref:GlxA family transcriptional regulator n=1 Tax=Methylocystis sp. TaxID=1911079 RepID=UPI003DA2C643
METHCSQLSRADPHFRRIGFLVYPDFQSLDLSGPFEAFHWADLVLGVLGRARGPSYQPLVIAEAAGPVRTMSGLQIIATQSYHEIRDGLDTLVVMGGTGCEAASQDAPLVAWVRSVAPATRRLVSICSGAFILAAAGLLHRRRATTHWMYADRLAKDYPSIDVDASLLFVRDGNVYTSGGITAGIDLALALVEEDLGTAAMLGVARHLLVFPRRPGGQSQFRGHSSIIEKSRVRPNISELQAWMLAHPEADLSIPALAERLTMSERSFSRLFRNETGQTPAEFAERIRADAARHKLEQTSAAIETIANECGFGNTERMRRTFQRLFEISPADYRARFRSMIDA